jgi:hypothetical protein
MLKGRTRTLAVTGVTVVAAALALVALSTTGAPAASPAPAAAAPRVMHASATAAHPLGVVRIIHRGLVKDCVEIQAGNTDLQIWDQGASQPVELSQAPASCWNLHNKFTYDGYTGYEYQDLRGDCLWDDASVIFTAAGPCQLGNPGEEFFGIGYDSGVGWTFTDVYSYPLGYYMSALNEDGSPVYMESDVTGLVWHWNFP